MYIAPNTTVSLLAGVPLDKNYLHTIYFSTRTAQNTYFQSKVTHTYSALSYQRLERGRVRVQADIGDVFNTNYLMFKNSSFENKWFYCFVTGVQYVSNQVVEITYEIDVMQTWFVADCTVGDCFVEREHVANDNIGWNTVPEGLEQGPYITSGSGTVLPQETPHTAVIVCATFDKEYSDVGAGRILDYTYSGLNYLLFDTVSEVNTFLEGAIEQNKIDGIVSISMIPENFPADYQPSSIPVDVSASIPKGWTAIDGYVPRNKKLFCWPYNKLSISTGADVLDYRYELFDEPGDDMEFRARFVCNPACAITLTPVRYKEGNFVTARATITDFPECPYTTDVYKVYLAQNKASLAVKMISAVGNAGASAVKGAIAGGPVGAVAGAAKGLWDNIAGEVAQQYDLSTKPPQVNGTQTGTADYSFRAKEFRWMQQSITRHYAAMLDGYFDMFGYRVNRVKVPEMSSRPYWNYVKCGYVNITGNIPADAMERIETIFQNGITFWKNGNNVGNYALDNTV